MPILQKFDHKQWMSHIIQVMLYYMHAINYLQALVNEWT